MVNNPLAELESIFITCLRPHFFNIEKDGNCILVTISHPSFSLLDPWNRISYLYSLIRNHNKDILVNNSVFFQAFSPEEMLDLFEYWL